MQPNHDTQKVIPQQKSQTIKPKHQNRTIHEQRRLFYGIINSTINELLIYENIDVKDLDYRTKMKLVDKEIRMKVITQTIKELEKYGCGICIDHMISYTNEIDTFDKCVTIINGLVTDSDFYIGVTNSPPHRLIQHAQEKGMGYMIILCEVLNREQATSLETKLIQRFTKSINKEKYGGSGIKEGQNYVYVLVPSKLSIQEIRLMNNCKIWNNEEEHQLKKLYLTEHKSINEIAIIHKRTYGAIKARLKKLGFITQ